MKNWDQHESEMKIERLRTDLAACEATLEHTSGYLGQEIEENAKLRAEIERLSGEKSYLSDEVIPALRQEIERLTAIAQSIQRQNLNCSGKRLSNYAQRSSGCWRPAGFSAPRSEVMSRMRRMRRMIENERN